MKISRAFLFTSVVMALQNVLAHREGQDPFWSLVAESENYESRRREERARDYSFGHSQEDRDFFHAFRLDRDEEPPSETIRRNDIHRDPVEERIMTLYQAGKQRDRMHEDGQVIKDTYVSGHRSDTEHAVQRPVPVAEEPVIALEIPEDSQYVSMRPVVHEPVHAEPMVSRPVYNEPPQIKPVHSIPAQSMPMQHSKPLQNKPVVHEVPQQQIVPSRPHVDAPKPHVVAFKLADRAERLYATLTDGLFKGMRGQELRRRLQQESVEGPFSEFLQEMVMFLAHECESMIVPFCSRNGTILRKLKRSKPRCNSLMLSMRCVPREDMVDCKKAIRQMQKRCKSLKGAKGCRFVEQVHALCQRVQSALCDKPCLTRNVRSVVASWLYEHDLALVVELKCGDYRLLSEPIM